VHAAFGNPGFATTAALPVVAIATVAAVGSLRVDGGGGARTPCLTAYCGDCGPDRTLYQRHASVLFSRGLHRRERRDARMVIELTVMAVAAGAAHVRESVRRTSYAEVHTQKRAVTRKC
jgi:hypothetical protein